jgi:hypothetical protein
MITTKWNFASGVLNGLTPYMAGQPGYEASLDACENMLIDFRGYLKQRPAIKHLAYVDDIIDATSVVSAMIPYSYQAAGLNIRGMIAIVQNAAKTAWKAVWSDGSTWTASASQSGDVSVVGVSSNASSNAIVVLVGSTYSLITYNGTTVSVTVQAMTVGTPKRGLITFQGRNIAISGDKTIIGSKVGTPYDWTTGTTASDGFSITLDMQGTIKNLMPSPKGGIIVYCDDAQWYLVPGSNGLFAPGSMAAQRLTLYEIDGEARSTGTDTLFMANSTVNKFNYSNDLQAYRAGRIAPTVSGKWLETFEAGGNYYAAIFDKTGTEKEITILELAEQPRATSIRTGQAISSFCPGDDGLFIATKYGFGFSLWYGYTPMPVDFYQTQSVAAGATGNGTFTVRQCATAAGTYSALASSIRVFYRSALHGLRSIPHTWNDGTKTVTFDKAAIINESAAVDVYVGISFDMLVRTQRLELAGQQPDGGITYTIGKLKNATAVMVVSNAVSLKGTFTSPTHGNVHDCDKLQPEGLSPESIHQVHFTMASPFDYETKVQIEMNSADNADREVVLYGLEITWDHAI